MLRVPTQSLATATINSTTTGSASVYFPVTDFTGIVAKLTMTTITSSALESMIVYLQTTDDGGTTWFDMAAFKTVTSASAMTNAGSQWIELPVDNLNSTATSASDATVGNGTNTGLPLLSNSVKVKWVITGTVTTVSGTVKFIANNQSQHA